MLRMKFMSTHCEIALLWIPQNNFVDMSTLIQVMARCCQFLPRFLSPYGAIWPYHMLKIWVCSVMMTVFVTLFDLFTHISLLLHWNPRVNMMPNFFWLLVATEVVIMTISSVITDNKVGTIFFFSTSVSTGTIARRTRYKWASIKDASKHIYLIFPNFKQNEIDEK